MEVLHKLYTTLRDSFHFLEYSIVLSILNSTSIICAQESILIFVQSGPFAQSIEKIFVANGYRVSLVSTEAAAYAAVKESAPSLIIIE